VPYVWGGETPGVGFDCSGLTQWAYRQAGIDIPRSAAAQYTVGKAVSLDGLAPGDLIFYGSTASNIHHVAMYVGDGKVVHAPTEGEDVRIVPIQNSGSDIFGAKRIVG
jgi:cell wall-associated NlpC family hydrolase